MRKNMANKSYTFEDLKEIIKILRSPKGCPWDRVQTHESLKPCLIEEAYEVFEGIDRYSMTGENENLCEELGDLLLQVLLHSEIAKEEESFTLDNVIQGLSEKLVRRHPHVFGAAAADTPEEGLTRWEEIKKKEKEKQPAQGELVSVPKAFPALLRAQKIQKKAANIYAYSPTWTDCIDTIEQCLDRIKKENPASPSKEVKDEIKHLLFETANLARFFKENAEISLTNAIEEFINNLEGVDGSIQKEDR